MLEAKIHTLPVLLWLIYSIRFRAASRFAYNSALHADHIFVCSRQVLVYQNQCLDPVIPASYMDRLPDLMDEVESSDMFADHLPFHLTMHAGLDGDFVFIHDVYDDDDHCI